MKKILLILGILILTGFSVGCTTDIVYEDDFNDGAVNTIYWHNFTFPSWSESGGIFTTGSHIKYTKTLANSDLYFTGNLGTLDGVNEWFRITDGKWGVECWYTPNYMRCYPIPYLNASSVCNDYTKQSFATNTYFDWDIQIAGNQLNFSWDGKLIQCNNTFQDDSKNIYMDFDGDNYWKIRFSSFTHGNQTKYTSLKWNTLNYYTDEPIEGMNITITHVQNSNYPSIPQNCITDVNGECNFLFDYFCNMSCDEVVMVEADVVDIYNRTESVAYDFFGIGRDENDEHSIITKHKISFDSHMVEFDIQDYSYNPINNAYVEAMNVVGVINYCTTNSSGKCKMNLLSNSTYDITIEGGYKYMPETTTLWLSPYVSYNINQSYFLETFYSNEANLSLVVKDVTDGVIGYNGTIKLMYLSGYSDLHGFTWYVQIANGTGNYYGLPKGTYEMRIYNHTDYYFYRYSEEEYLGDYYDFFNIELLTVEEILYYNVKYWSGVYNVTGRVYGATNWSNWDAGIFIKLNETEISFGNQYYTYTKITDNYGMYAIPNMKAGEYNVFIFPPIEYQPYQEIRLIDQNRMGLDYYCKPNEPEPIYNISICGYVDFNDTMIPSLSIRVIPERGNIETIYTNSEGFYNWSREWNVPQTITMIYNYNSHLDEYDTETVGVYMSMINKHKCINISLSEKKLLWEVIGNFKDSEGNLILCDWTIRRKGIPNETIRSGVNKKVFHVYNLEPDDYIIYLSSPYIGNTEREFELSDSYEFWDYNNGIHNIGTIIVNPTTDFHTIYISTFNLVGAPVKNVLIKTTSLDSESPFGVLQCSTDSLGHCTFTDIPTDNYFFKLTINGRNVLCYLGTSDVIIDPYQCAFQHYVDSDYTQAIHIDIEQIPEEPEIDENEFWTWLGDNIYSFAQVIIMLFMLYIMSQLLTGIAGGGN